MTTYYSDTAELLQATLTGQSANFTPGNVLGGRIAFARSTIESNGGMVANDTIQLAFLPKGAVIVPHFCKICNESFGTTFSIKIGNEQSANAYANAISLKTAGEQSFTGASSALAPVALEKAQWVTATITEASAVIAQKKAVVWLAYIIP